MEESDGKRMEKNEKNRRQGGKTQYWKLIRGRTNTN